MTTDKRSDDLLNTISQYLNENYDDIVACDSQSDLDWISLRLANAIDGGVRSSV